MTFASVYEMFHPLHVERKTHFWDWLDGDNLKSFWNIVNEAGTGTVSMNDAVDEGLDVQTDTVTTAITTIQQGDIRHYSNNGAVMITRQRKVQATNAGNETGFFVDTSFSDYALLQNRSSNAFQRLETRDMTTTTSTNTSIAPSEAFQIIKLELTGSSALLWIDAVLEVAKTTNLPTGKQQICLTRMWNESAGGAANARVSYIEAYNT